MGTERVVIRLPDLTKDPEILSVLQEYSLPDAQIDIQVLDHNSDGYLDYKHTFFSRLNSEQYLSLQNNLQRFGFKSRDTEDVLDAYEVYADLQQDGINADKIFTVLEEQASWFLAYNAWEIPHLLKCFASPAEFIEFLQLLIKTDPWGSHDYWKIRFAFSFLKNSGELLLQKDWQKFLKTVSGILSYLNRSKLKMATRALENLKVDWKNCRTLSSFGNELARTVNEQASMSVPEQKWPETLSNVTAMICNIYENEKERDDKTDFILGFGQVLSDQAFHQLISHGGRLLTVVFDLLWSHRHVTSVSQWMATADPENSLRGRFFKSLSSLNRIEIFSVEVEFVVEALFEELLNQDSDIGEHAVIVTHYIDTLLPSCDTQERAHIARLLWGYLQKSENHAQLHSIFLFWIKYYTPQYGLDEYQAELKTVAQDSPEIPSAVLPVEEWLEDKCLVARQCFYSEEEYTENQDEKGDGQVWFEYTQKLLVNSHGWKIVSQDLNSDLKICILEKNVKGILLRTIVTLQMDDGSFMPLPDQDKMEIIAHRGHYQPLASTFPLDRAEAGQIPQLLYLGACKSLSYAAQNGFQAGYQDDFYIADQDVSRGKTSIEFLDELMTDVAHGKVEWDKYKKYRQEHKFVLPNSPMFLVGRYMRDSR